MSPSPDVPPKENSENYSLHGRGVKATHFLIKRVSTRRLRERTLRTGLLRRFRRPLTSTGFRHRDCRFWFRTRGFGPIIRWRPTKYRQDQIFKLTWQYVELPTSRVVVPFTARLRNLRIRELPRTLVATSQGITYRRPPCPGARKQSRPARERRRRRRERRCRAQEQQRRCPPRAICARLSHVALAMKRPPWRALRSFPRRPFRPNEASKAAVGYVRNTSIPVIYCIALEPASSVIPGMCPPPTHARSRSSGIARSTTSDDLATAQTTLGAPLAGMSTPRA
jgi:hypothetical protein